MYKIFWREKIEKSMNMSKISCNKRRKNYEKALPSQFKNNFKYIVSEIYRVKVTARKFKSRGHAF